MSVPSPSVPVPLARLSTVFWHVISRIMSPEAREGAGRPDIGRYDAIPRVSLSVSFQMSSFPFLGLPRSLSLSFEVNSWIGMK